MNKYTLLLLILILSSCDSNTLDSKKNKLDKLNNSLLDIELEIKNLEQEIELLDSGFNKKNYVYISTISPDVNKFFHKVQLRGTVFSRSNVLLNPEMIGRLKRIYVKEGDSVIKGQILAEINSDVLNNSILEIKTNLELFKVIYERQKNLWENNIGSEIEYLKSKSNYDVFLKRFETNKIQLLKYKIVSPFSGMIDKVFLNEGEMSSPAAPIFRIFSGEDSYLKIDASEAYIGKFNIKDNVDIVIPNLDTKVESKILSIGQVIDVQNRSFSIEINIPESLQELVKPNQVMVVEMVDYSNPNAILIPSNVIYSDDMGEYVFGT
ncbi:MAG: efflux RND transporter periplasmic adaptor subunit, partial [Bacteroidota bacterium]|nr:efflux RND transporter periplasmic adaptor subunit [Bacteroidota bacterium]